MECPTAAEKSVLFGRFWPLGQNGKHMFSNTDHTLSQKLLLSCAPASAASGSERRVALFCCSGACEARGG